MEVYLCWLSHSKVSLDFDSANVEEDSTSTESPPNEKKFEYVKKFKNKIENTQKLYSLAYVGVIRPKNQIFP
jgi:hypothetical protein